MKKENIDIFTELNEILNEFFDEEQLKTFYNKIKTKSAVPDKIENVDEKDLNQISAKLQSGINLRILIDNLITFAEPKLKKPEFMQLLLSLSQFLIKTGELDFAQDLSKEVVLKSKSDEGLNKMKAEAYLNIAKIYCSQSMWKECISNVKKANDIFENLNDQIGLAKCENLLGTSYGERGKISTAQKHFQKGLNLIKNSNDQFLKGAFEINLGILYNIQGDLDKAMDNYKSGLKRFIELGDDESIARIRHNIGMLFLQMNKYDEAVTEFDKSIQISLKKSYLSNCALSYLGKASVYTKIGKSELADKFTDKAMEIAYKLNDTLTIADIYRIKGIIQKNLNNFALSEEFFENSIRLNKDFENELNLAESYFEFSDLFKQLEKQKESQIQAYQSLKYFNKIKSRNKVKEVKSKLKS